MITLFPIGNNQIRPKSGTPRSAGLDLAASENTTIPPHATQLIRTGWGVIIPDGSAVLLMARSSLHKLGLILANGVGLIDPDYCGPDDEIKIPLHNLRDTPVNIDRGMRLAQLVQVKIESSGYTYRIVDESGDTISRGGFGSTGTA
jgi:dUTP pyrophosphatase